MSWKSSLQRVAWVGAGLVFGLALSAMFSGPPIHATATSQQDSLVLATGPMDGQGEAVFCLDALTGDLKGWVLGNRGNLAAMYGRNVLADLGVDLTKGPKFTLVTGNQQFQNSGGAQWASCVVWVAELTSGKMIGYTMLWNQAIRNNRAVPKMGDLIPLGGPIEYRRAIVR